MACLSTAEMPTKDLVKAPIALPAPPKFAISTAASRGADAEVSQEEEGQEGTAESEGPAQGDTAASGNLADLVWLHANLFVFWAVC